MRVVVWFDSADNMTVSNDILPGDETVEVPDVLYHQYVQAFKDLRRLERQISQFTREQERERFYAND